MKKASPAVCNTCGAGVCLHVSRAEDGYLSRIRELESRANAREVEVRAHMEARFAAEAERARLHQALDAAHAEASDCGNSENDEACGECRECWHVTKESMCRRISRAEMARDARTQDIAALRAENDRLRAENVELRGMLFLVGPYCEDFHHAKKDRHEFGEPCPIEARWRAIAAPPEEKP